jgi:hypothetical protein
MIAMLGLPFSNGEPGLPLRLLEREEPGVEGTRANRPNVGGTDSDFSSGSSLTRRGGELYIMAAKKKGGKKKPGKKGGKK